MILQDLNRVITNGVARSPDLFGVNLIDVRDRSTNPDASFFAVWQNGGWRAGVSIPWKVVAMGTLGDPPDRFVLLGEEGNVCLLGGGRQDEERVDREVGLPLTGFGTVAEQVYAIGMGRQVYLREQPDRWIARHGNMLSTQPPDVVGLQTIVGSRVDNVFAAGWGGEIWHFDGNKWTQEDSPTNHILGAGISASDGSIVFCGRNGTVVLGKKGMWRVLDIDERDDLWSVAEFRGELYFSSQASLYRLVGEELESVIPEVDAFRGTYYSLQVVDGHLFSFGERDVLIFDGSDWSRVPTE